MEEMTFGFSPARTTTPGPRKKKFPFGVLVGGELINVVIVVIVITQASMAVAMGTRSSSRTWRARNSSIQSRCLVKSLVADIGFTCELSLFLC